ncbi:MAG: hypothetical protein ABI574_12505 [Burkholderiales bacterium]
MPFGTTVPADKLTSQVYGFGPDDVQLALAPLYHAAPLSWGMGCQRMGGGQVFEYHKDTAKSRGAYSKQGYSTLGDFGYLDQEGYLYIADRRTDLILSGGVNIYPPETEEALLMHPAALDVAVIGVPHPDFGQEVLAVVELQPGFEPSAALSTELIEFCRSKIAHFKCPRRADFGKLPRTETGKLQRRKLKDQYAAAAAR